MHVVSRRSFRVNFHIRSNIYPGILATDMVFKKRVFVFRNTLTLLDNAQFSALMEGDCNER